MKIGVLFSAYNCAEYIDRCLEPWLKLKKELNLILAATNGRYIFSPEESQDMKGSHSLLKLLGKDLDFLLHSCAQHRWTEEQGRDYMLKYVIDQEVDLVWVIDCDEIYTEKNIRDILSYVQKNPGPDCYNLYYKNYAFKYPYWTSDFNKTVIYWTNRKGGLRSFCFDCDLSYNDGTMLNIVGDVNVHTINKQVALIEHYTWLSDDPRTEDKIHNQDIKYKGEKGSRCGYVYDENDKLTWNKTYFKDRNIAPPNIYKDLVDVSYVCDIYYDWSDNALHFKNIVQIDNYDIDIKDSSGQSIYSLRCYLDRDYYIAPNKDLKQESYVTVTIRKNGLIIKQQEIHINFKL